MKNRTNNPWWWHRWISKPAVTKMIEENSDYSRLNNLIDNKNASGDMDALVDAIFQIHDLCENAALCNYLQRRKIFTNALYISSAVFSFGYLSAHLASAIFALQVITAFISFGFFAAASWTTYRTPAVIQHIESTNSDRKTVTFTRYLNRLGYEVEDLME